MSILLFLAWLAVVAFAALVIMKVIGYVKKPAHLRWEIYPVAHEAPEKVAYGGSYLEEVDWWKKPYHSSVVGALKGFLVEALTLKATWEHNRPLWFRTCPFHWGIYLLFGALGLTVLTALCRLAGCNGFACFLTALTVICDVLGFCGILFGALGLIQRRLCDAGLRKYSMPEHYFNLGAFAVYAALGLCLCLGNSAWSFAEMGNALVLGMISFTGAPLAEVVTPTYVIYLIVTFFLFVWVPVSFLGHLFMKYFTWHDIRWGDQPFINNPKLQQKLANNLDFPVSWRAPHIQGDGMKTWAEVATSDPEKKD